MKNKMVKVFIDEKLWNDKVMMDLESLSRKPENKDKLVYTTQKFKFDMPTLAVIVGAAAFALLIGGLLGKFVI